jgi:acyl-CoA synthetase (AMP-forming)/AMP-acid ligase II
VTTPSDLLARELRRDGARPFITWYDATTGGRVELSVATTANWVAKTAGYLLDEIGIAPGDQVDVDGTPHWISAVLLLASWAVGAEVATSPSGSAERLDVPLDPMGAGFSALVAAYPDAFTPSEPSGGDAVDALSPGVPDGARVLSVLPLQGAGIGWALLGPLAAGGSVVLAPDDEAVAARAAAERITHTVGLDVPGLPRLD